MKTMKIYSIFILIIALNYACTKSFFDLYPTDQLTEGNFFTNSNDYEAILNDGYRLLRTPYNVHYVIGDLASDDAYNSKHNNNVDRITMNESNVSSDNGVLNIIWSGSYAVISRANMVLDKIDNCSMQNELKNRYKGEAKFLRSLMYFNLIRIFGDVPLVLTEVDSPEKAFEYSRESIDIIYTQIIADLTDSEKWLPDVYTKNSEAGRATSLAAKSLLGHIFLTRKNYDDAASKLLEVINSNKHNLLTNYEDVFDAAQSNNEEVIFAVQFARGLYPAQGNPLVYAAWPNESVGDHPLLRLGSGNFLMTGDLERAFEENDKRKLMNNYDFITGYAARYVFTRKFWDKHMVDKLDSGCDYIIYRYADILLMYAETQNELNRPNEALKYLKIIRDRAGLVTDDNLGSSQSLMRLALEKERRIELNNEGHRWFDLLRTDRLIPVMNAHFKDTTLSDWEIGTNNSIEEYELVFPIPLFEVNLNPDKIVQNPGY
ncbi:MAG: RagB/SusD family nutrient uptake outer membrane protein [Fermentimonas sp.]